MPETPQYRLPGSQPKHPLYVALTNAFRDSVCDWFPTGYGHTLEDIRAGVLQVTILNAAGKASLWYLQGLSNTDDSQFRLTPADSNQVTLYLNREFGTLVRHQGDQPMGLITDVYYQDDKFLPAADLMFTPESIGNE